MNIELDLSVLSDEELVGLFRAAVNNNVYEPGERGSGWINPNGSGFTSWGNWGREADEMQAELRRRLDTGNREREIKESLIQPLHESIMYSLRFRVVLSDDESEQISDAVMTAIVDAMETGEDHAE
jgi:hypothetical protein